MIRLLSHAAWMCAGTLVLGPLGALMYQLAGRYFIGYAIRPTCVEILALHLIPVRRIAYRKIAGVRVVRFRKLRDFTDPKLFGRYLFAQRFGNRVVGDAVLIELKAGISRAVFITPDDAPAFAAAVAQKLPEEEKGTF